MARKKVKKKKSPKVVATKQVNVGKDRLYMRVYKRSNNTYVANLVHRVRNK